MMPAQFHRAAWAFTALAWSCALFLTGALFFSTGVEAAGTRAYFIAKPADGRTIKCSQGWDVGKAYAVVNELGRGDKVLAYAELIDRRNVSGWDELLIVANASELSSRERRFAAGALEGFLTADRIANLIANVKSLRDQDLLPETMAYLFDWHTRIRFKALKPETNDAFWTHVLNVLERVTGLSEAMNSYCSKHPVLYEDLLLLQSDMDVVEVERLIGYKKTTLKDSLLLALGVKTSVVSSMRQGSENAALNNEEFRNQLLSNSRCSALIRRTTAGDIIVGHATWAKYAEMIRVFKHVDFGEGYRTSYSGYAGIVASTDDFYVTSSGLAVLETSLNVIDTESLEYLKQNQLKGVPSWIRTVIATEQARTGSEWVNWYSREMSYTGNCQWLIVDRKRVKKFEGLLTVLETLPGIVGVEDKTHLLLSQGFFSSQNTPLLPDVRNRGRYPKTASQLQEEMCTTCKCHYSYDNNPRGCIFRRSAPHVNTVEDMMRLMRDNNYKSDPLSFRDPSNAVAARNDLRTSDRDASGAIDAKILSFVTDDDFASPRVIGGIVVNNECPPFSDYSLFTSSNTRYQGVAGLDDGPKKWFRPRRFVI